MVHGAKLLVPALQCRQRPLPKGTRGIGRTRQRRISAVSHRAHLLTGEVTLTNLTCCIHRPLHQTRRVQPLWLPQLAPAAPSGLGSGATADRDGLTAQTPPHPPHAERPSMKGSQTSPGTQQAEAPAVPGTRASAGTAHLPAQPPSGASAQRFSRIRTVRSSAARKGQCAARCACCAAYHSSKYCKTLLPRLATRCTIATRLRAAISPQHSVLPASGWL